MIGADIVEIKRIAEAINSARFLARVFTPDECAYCRKKARPAESFAGIYAAKEAVAKVSGKGIIGPLTDIEIVHSALGAPEVVLHGKMAEIVKEKVFVSVSHDGEYAFAVASVSQEDFAPVLPGKEIEDGDLDLLPRRRFTHKGDYGRVYVIGGSEFMVGAPLICAEAAVRSGAGLTTLCVPNSLIRAYQSRVKEIMLLGLDDEKSACDIEALSTICNKANAVIMGMGMGNSAVVPEIIRFIMNNFEGTLVCDADAVNALSRHAELLVSDRKCKLILTPHVGEFGRLAEALKIEDVQQMALETGAVIAKKSAYTVVTDGITTYKITSGCAAMAKGGSGDALAGIIGAYACRTTPLNAAALAAHYFGRCGEKAAAVKGENAVTATDIINCL